MTASVPFSIESTTVERVRVIVTTPVDPTAAAPEFSVTTGGRADPGSFVAGSWDTTWNSEDGRIESLTPTIGASGAGLTVEADTEVDLWMRWTAGVETPVKRVGSIPVL